MYHDLKVDGVSLKGYKIYINGTEAYNSAERDVEFIEIPGRSGAFALDKKRFKNITVQYNSGTFAENQPEFARKISDLRNFLASRDGYVRIEDDYNPEEYRMGVFSRGLEFDPVCYNMASEFPIEFNCKPQRFLKIGDLPVSVASGDVITNPTLFDAHPLIKFQASGNGSITIGDKVVQFYNAPLGLIPLDYSVGAQYESTSDTRQVVTFSGSYNTGDSFTINGAKATLLLIGPDDIHSIVFNSTDLSYAPYESNTSGQTSTQTWKEKAETSFVIGTSRTVTKNSSISITFGGSTYTVGIRLTIVYNGGNQIQYRWTIVPNGSGVTCGQITIKSNYSIICDSTANSLTGDLYMDLDIGEAYRIENGNVVSINNFTNLGGELPVLPPGSTAITFDNTISNVEITPRYWRV